MGNLMILAGVGGILTSWNAFIIGGSRVLYALGESGMIPDVFCRIHPRFKTPHISILVIGLLSCISPFFGRTILVWLVDAGSFAIVIAYAMVAFAFIRLRLVEPDMERPFKVRHWRFVGYSAFTLSCCLGLLYLPGSPSGLLWPYEWAMVLGGSLVGLAFYINSIRANSIRAKSIRSSAVKPFPQAGIRCKFLSIEKLPRKTYSMRSKIFIVNSKESPWVMYIL